MLPPALSLTLGHAIMMWRVAVARWMSLMAFASVLATQAILIGELRIELDARHLSHQDR